MVDLRRTNEWITGNGYGLAAGIGLIMIIVGTALAALERPESALIWAGALVMVLGLLGSRFLSIRIGAGSAEFRWREEVIAVRDEIDRNARRVDVSSVTLPISGSFWTAKAVDNIIVAASDPNRTAEALDELRQLSAAGTAAVRIETDAERSQRVREDDALRRRQRSYGPTDANE
jgi:hypothetical protein